MTNLRPITDLIRCAPRTADTERAEWQGRTAMAQFQAAKVRDMRRIFGKRSEA